MADEEGKSSDGDQEEQRAEALQKSIKINRILLIALVSLMFLVLSVLGASFMVINGQMAERREVPTEEFDEELVNLKSHLEHLVTLHNSEAQVYFDFQDTLATVKESYTHQKVNDMRQLLIDREKDHQKLLQLMEENASSLASMISGSREWTGSYSKKINDAVQLSQTREKSLKQAMADVSE